MIGLSPAGHPIKFPQLLDAEKAKRTRQDAFRKMQETRGVYDPQVLEAVAACFDIYLDKVETETSRRESVRISELKVSSILAEDITTLEGALIVPSGTQITPPLLQKLRNFAELAELKEPIIVHGK